MESNRDSLVFCVKFFSGVFALISAIAFMLFFFGSIRGATFDGVLKVGAFVIICATIFVVCLAVDSADRGEQIKILKGEKRALLRGKEDVGHALAALQNCIIEGPKSIPVWGMRMRVNTIVIGLDLPVGFDTEKLKEWEEKILATALFK